MKELLEFAQKQAKRAGKILLDHFGHLEHIRHKKDDSLVTEADMLSEQFIRKAIEKNYPTHQILGEEEGFDSRGGRWSPPHRWPPSRKTGSGVGHPKDELHQDKEFTWVIDPLDGTSNFASGLPLFAVSIGLFRKRTPVLGVIFDPTRNDCYWAIEGEPAYRNGVPIQVSNRPITFSTVTAFGSLWEGAKDRRIAARMIQKTKGRNLGSCVLHLTSVASGQMEFAIMEKVKLWDLAAAGFILLQAGGRLTDLEGKRIFPLARSFTHYSHSEMSFVASNGRVHRQVLNEIVSPG